jgi:hypothetical protein
MLRRVCWYILADVSKVRNASIFRSVQSKKGFLDPEGRSSQLLRGNLPSGAFPSQKTRLFFYVLLRTASLSECFCKRLLLLLLLLSHLLTYLLAYLLTYLFTYLLKYLLTYLHTYLLTYLLTYLHTYLLTYLLTYILTYLFTYLLTCLLAYLLTHSLTPWSRVLEKLTGFQLVKIFPAFYGT